MGGAVWFIIASLAGLAGVIVLRAAWARRQRSRVMNFLGWSLIFGAAVCGSSISGAWGVAIVALTPMAGALGLLAISGIFSAPAKPSAPPRRANARSETGAAKRLAARGLTFLFVSILAAVVGLGIATAATGVALLFGAGKSDAYATAMFMMPLTWGALAFALLMQPRRRGQLKVLLIASIPAWPCLATGLLS